MTRLSDLRVAINSPHRAAVRDGQIALHIVQTSTQTEETTVRRHPFELINASTELLGARVRVVFGTVNSVIPDGMVAGDDPQFYVNVSDEDFVYLHVTTDDDGEVIAVEIAAGDMDSLTEDENNFYLAIGVVSVDSSGDVPIVYPSQSISGSQSFDRCRNWFTNPATYRAEWALV